MGLRISESHNLDEIACEIVYSLILFTAYYYSILFINYTICVRGSLGDEIII